MRARSTIAAVLAVAALSLGGVLASATTATAALPDGTLTIHQPLLAPALGFEGDVVFSGTGWTPGHPVIVELVTDFGIGSTVVSAHTVTADQDGAIEGSWTISSYLLGDTHAFTAREEATAGNGHQTRSSNVVPLLTYPSPGVSLDTDSFFLGHFTEEDATWGGGIEFTSKGWTPGATVVTELYRWTDIDTYELESAGWVANQDGIVEGVWQPSSLIPELVTDTGYPAFDLQAFEFDADGTLVKASNVEELTVVRSGSAPTIEVADPVYPPGSFTRGIQLEGSGFTPGATVTGYFWIFFEPGMAGRYHTVAQADGEGRISFLMGPNPAWPSADLPANGYPQYVVRVAEHGGDGSQIVAVSNEALLTVATEPAAPVIEPPASIPADELAAGVAVPFSGFDPGETIAFTLSAVIGGQQTVLETLEAEADSEGRGLLRFAITGLTGDPRITIVGVGNQSQARAEVTFTADVADDPSDPGDPGGTGNPGDPGGANGGVGTGVQGDLAQTGVDGGAAGAAGGIAAGLVIFGMLLLVVHRRRIAGLLARR